MLVLNHTHCAFIAAGKQYWVYSGKECARALAKDSLAVEDCTADLSDCSEEELLRLKEKLTHIKEVYDEVGKVRVEVLTIVDDIQMDVFRWQCSVKSMQHAPTAFSSALLQQADTFSQQPASSSGIAIAVCGYVQHSTNSYCCVQQQMHVLMALLIQSSSKFVVHGGVLAGSTYANCV